MAVLLSSGCLTGMGPGLEEIKVEDGKLLAGRWSNFLVDLTMARLLWREALDGWQQEASMPSWPPSATAFVRGRKRDGGKKCLVTRDGVLRAEEWGKASLLGELCVAASAERSALCWRQGIWLDGSGMICFLRLGMEKNQGYCSPVPLELKYEEGEMKKSL